MCATTAALSCTGDAPPRWYPAQPFCSSPPSLNPGQDEQVQAQPPYNRAAAACRRRGGGGGGGSLSCMYAALPAGDTCNLHVGTTLLVSFSHHLASLLLLLLLLFDLPALALSLSRLPSFSGPCLRALSPPALSPSRPLSLPLSLSASLSASLTLSPHLAILESALQQSALQLPVLPARVWACQSFQGP